MPSFGFHAHVRTLAVQNARFHDSAIVLGSQALILIVLALTPSSASGELSKYHYDKHVFFIINELASIMGFAALGLPPHAILEPRIRRILKYSLIKN